MKPGTKKWLLSGGAFLVGVIVLAILACSPPHAPAPAVQLVITGPEGQRFTGNYIADGTANAFNGMVPTNITLRARQLTYSFQPEDGRQEFRVALKVDDAYRTSRISYKGAPVQGGWRCWNHDLQMLRDMILSGDIFSKRWSYWIKGESSW